jgi:hypothetical protein
MWNVLSARKNTRGKILTINSLITHIIASPEYTTQIQIYNTGYGVYNESMKPWTNYIITELKARNL